MRKLMSHCFQEAMMTWVSTSQGVEGDAAGVEIDHGSNEPVKPSGVHQEGVSEEVGYSPGAGATKVDEASAGAALKVEFPPRGKGAARGSRFDAGGGSLAVRVQVPAGALLEGRERFVEEPGPDLALPPAVEALDGPLEARLSRRDEHRGDLEAQAEAGDAPDRVGMHVGSLEARVVVELGVRGQPRRLSSFPSSSLGTVGGKLRLHGLWSGRGDRRMKLELPRGRAQAGAWARGRVE